MRSPDTVCILNCGHVEHPKGSGNCQTIDCDNEEPKRHVLHEWASALVGGLLLLWVRLETGQGIMEIYLDRLPDLFGG